MTMDEAKDIELKAIANEVVEKCAGLPLLIIIIATYLKNNKLCARRDALKKLFDFGNEELNEKVHRVLKSIYKSLPSNEVKSFFLLCALFGQSNIPINHLVTYAIGLCLFRNIFTVQGARYRVDQIIETLKINHLLLDGDMKGYVKMHNAVLDFALSMATKEQHAFFGISGHGLREWPSKDCTRIALPYCDIKELPRGLGYPKAELFSLFSKDLYLRIPCLFFEGFRELKVLNLTGKHFKSLPTSLHLLTNLNSLYLNRCDLIDVTIIGDLKQLEFLSFADSYIIELPKQLMQLSQLKVLDLTNCTIVNGCPANILSKLSLLEELYMGNCFVRSDEEGNTIMELEELCHLTTLEIQVRYAKKLPNCLFSSGLQRYKICIGNGLYWGEEHGSSRWLKLRLKASNHMEHGLKEFLRGTEALYLYEVRGIENLLYDLDGKSSRLKHLHIEEDDLVRYIINSTMQGFCHIFPTLETLSLGSLNRLEEICHGQLETESFSKLRILKVNLCHKLRNLLSYSAAKCLSQLEEIEVECCDNMDAIIGEASEDEEMEFTQLSSLKLTYLSQLRSIFGRKVTFPNLQIMSVDHIENLEHIWDSQLTVDSFYKLKSLTISSCRNLLDIFSLNVVRSFQRLADQNLSYCLKIEEIYKLGGLNSIDVAPFEIRNLNIAPSSVSFQNLTILHVTYCDKLENLVTPLTAKTMVHLMELRITYCEMIKEIVANDGDSSEHEIIFSCLKSLELLYLPTLYNFCSDNYILCFPFLEEVIVENCLRMKIFCGGVLSTPKLRGVRHWKCEEVQYWNGNLNATIASQCFRKKVLQNADKWYVIEDSSSPKAILFNQLQFLNMLKKINVSDCAFVQVVFDLEDVSVKRGHDGLLPKLEELSLINLPKLSELWNIDPVRIFDFRKLRLLKVQNCSSLKYVFTQSMTSSLIALQVIKIENCRMMEVMIKEEAEETELPMITLPSLKKISIKGCPSMKEFLSPLLSKEQNPKPNEEGIREQIIGMQKLHEIAMPMIEELRIDWDIIKHKLNNNNQPDFFSRLKVIELVSPSNSFLTMEKLVLSDSLVEEIIIQELDNHHESTPWLGKMILSKLPNLKHIVYDNDPQRVFVFQNLQVLQVWECHKLEILVPSMVSFQNLTFLQVSTCDGLINLMTASTIKSLVQLKTMYVGRCKRLREIVKLELDGEESEMGFSRLEYLVLDDLPCLRSFCSNYKTFFDFPCLEEVFVIKCPKLEVFATAIKTTNLSQVQTGGKEHEWEWKGNLNSTVQALFMERKI